MDDDDSKQTKNDMDDDKMIDTSNQERHVTKEIRLALSNPRFGSPH